MNISKLFILRPIATSLLMVALFLSGLMAYRYLPIAALPQIDYPTIQVMTLYPGASPEVMANVVTSPLEKQFGSISGLTQLSSVSSGGASVITMQFDLSVSLDIAEQEVQAAINAATTLLPKDLPSPPVYSKVNPADPPILTLAITSRSMPLTELEDLVDTRLAQKISQISGVGLVTLSGGQRPAVRIQANPKALASYGLTLNSIRQSISDANVNGAKGSFDGPAQASSIDANDQLTSAEQYANIVIGYQNAAPLRLKDIATVTDGTENALLAAYVSSPPSQDGNRRMEQAILLSVQRQPGANVIKVADGIIDIMPQLQSALPGNVNVRIITDRTVTIRATVHDVQLELLLAVILVIGVIWLFLRNASATLIPALAVPLSLVGSLGVMYLAGFSLNNLTLMAFVIATGFVVDDAIVVIENISRYLEEGYSPLQASLQGAGQIGFTIISLTISLVAVLIPLLFMSDVVGRLFREFAITLSITILLSAIISLTLTPMLCAIMLRPQKTPHPEENNGFFAYLLKGYAFCLDWVFRHQALTLCITVGTLILTVALYIVVPKGFFPTQDTGTIQGILEAEQGSSFNSMVARQQQLAQILLTDPAVAEVSCSIGVDGINPTMNTSRLTISLKTLSERDARAPEITKRLMHMTQRLPGIKVYLQPVQDLTIEDRISRTQYQFTLEAITHADLQEWTPRLAQALAARPEIAEVAHDLQDKGKMAYVQINRDTAARLGISISDVNTALYDALGQRLISTIYTQTNQYKVVLEIAPQFRAEPTALENIYVSSSGGTPVPMSAFARIEERPTMLSVNRQSQFPASTISFNVADGYSLGAATTALEEAIALQNPPASLRITLQGAAKAFQGAAQNQVWLILAAIITMYIVLGVLYESYIHPITILSTLPSAGVGALLGLMALQMDLGVVGLIGIILLIGIVKKNAIMMIDFALEAERHEGKAPLPAIRQACLLRLRPILMTTMSALLGALPLMIGWGMGAELRRPLGVTMVGGLIFSQVLTLFTTPIIYLWFDRLSRRFRHQSTDQGSIDQDMENAPALAIVQLSHNQKKHL